MLNKCTVTIDKKTLRRLKMVSRGFSRALSLGPTLFRLLLEDIYGTEVEEVRAAGSDRVTILDIFGCDYDKMREIALQTKQTRMTAFVESGDGGFSWVTIVFPNNRKPSECWKVKVSFNSLHNVILKEVQEYPRSHIKS